MVGLLHHRPENPLDFIDLCLDRVREIGWKNVRWNTFVEDTEGIVTINLQADVVTLGGAYNGGIISIVVYRVTSFVAVGGKLAACGGAVGYSC